MAVPIKLVLLICIIETVRAQFPDADTSITPQRPRPPGRFLSRPVNRASSALVQQPHISHQRSRRPISLKSKPTADINEFSTFTAARPRPNFLPTLKSENSSTSAPQLLQQDQPTKPVSEETREDEENVNQQPPTKIVPVGPLIFQPSSHLISNSPLTAKPDSVIHFRPSPTPSFSRQPQLQEENKVPIQYRPPKPIKFRKPVEEVLGMRNPVENQQPQFQQQQPQYHQQQQVQHHELQSHLQEQQQHHKQQPQQQQSLIRQMPKKATSYREKKPVAQIIRRWREDNDDGSITWGFENDDGSYKEEIIGIDCVTRGKYGYVDPDGIRREYTYETGIKCNEEQQQGGQDNGFVDYQENKLVLPNGKTFDLSNMGKKQTRRPQPIYKN